MRRWLPAACVVAILVLPSCGFVTFARVTVNDPITQDDVAFIVPGETAFSEVVHRLGTPDELSLRDSGAVASYHFLDVRYARLNATWPAQLWSSLVPDFILSSTGLGTDVFEVFYDRRWRVQDHAFARHVRPRGFNPWPFGSVSSE